MYSRVIIDNLLKLHPDVSKFRLSTYLYIPDKTGSPRKFYLVSRKNLHSKIAELDNAKKAGWAVAVDSGVVLKGRKFMIPQVDFRLEYSRENKREIISSLKSIGLKRGMLVRSGKSFHYYGGNILDIREWLSFLGKILRLNYYSKSKKHIVVDQRWVGAVLIQGYGSLRISDSTTKPYLPEFIEFL